MKADEHGITFTWPGFAAACLAISSVLTAFGASHLRLGLRPLHFLLLLVLQDLQAAPKLFQKCFFIHMSCHPLKIC